MNGILDTWQLKIRSEETPYFSKELVDANKVGPYNFIRFLLQLYSVSNSGFWNPTRDQSLETGFLQV